jgi:tuftelin-interacting protein 11
MPRRKRDFMDDGISDSSGGSDDEIADDDDTYQRKRRRRSGDDDSEDEGFAGRRKPAQRHDWAKAPAFVSSNTTKPQLDQSDVIDIPEVVVDRVSGSESSGDSAEDEDGEADVEADDPDSADEDGDGDGDDDEQDTEPSRVPSPRVRDDVDEEEQRPRFGGLGLGASSSRPPTTFSGFTKSGIGASRPAAISIPPTPTPPTHSPSPAPPAPDNTSIPNNLPSAFGVSARPQRAFVRNGASSTPPPSKPNLSVHESAHFRKIGDSLGARMLAKMGWESGSGLGAEGQGIVVPVESKVRPKNMGIAFKGFGERTEQSRAEARRRGELVSDDEEEGRKKKASKGKEKENKRSDVWKKPKKIKTKIEHKTYEQIVAEVGEDTAGPSGLGVIIDATGATVSDSRRRWLTVYSLSPS